METTTDKFSAQDTAQADLKIKIIGVGGAGTNAVDGLKLDDLAPPASESTPDPSDPPSWA